MSETKHSPEPWRAWREAGGGLTDLLAGDGESVPAQRCTPADARRIVACVNACAGIPTEALEAGKLAAALELLRLLYVEDAEAEDACYRVLRALGRLP